MKSTRVAASLIFAVIGGTAVVLMAAGPHPSPAYVEYCAKCHGEDGKGNTPKGKQLMARDFTDAEWQSAKSDAELIKIVTKGGEDMPAFGKKFSKEQIQNLVRDDVRGFGRAGKRESGAERPKGARRPRYSAVDEIGSRREAESFTSSRPAPSALLFP
ncbi:MAG: cytochrome c [Acidobacteria bacterium]|nr:cytochrome c [Acidobacteriota bacterium]MCA1612486.1 cytochrome c [Acidobacteriota bacterium]